MKIQNQKKCCFKLVTLKIWIISFCFSSCNLLPHSIKKADFYFDLADFVNEQATELQRLEPKVSKTVLYHAKKESKSLIIKNWKSELKIFTKENINKASFKDRYIVKDSVSGNTKFRIYRAMEQGLNTRSLLLAFEKGWDYPTAIQIHSYQSNMMYASEKKLSLNCIFDSRINKGILSNYSIQGSQKSIFGSTMKYSLKVELIHNQ